MTRFLSPITLNDGHRLPALGLGTFDLRGNAGMDALLCGLKLGYRLLDTATGYRNETIVGAALYATSVAREDIVVTSKIRGADHAYDLARRSVRESRERLGGEPVDLYLVHWPNPRVGLYREAWRALVDARADGDVISIGVSNFERPHLEAIIEDSGVVPAVNQIEMHPHFPQPELRQVNTELGILTQSWSPFGRRGELFADPAIVRAAAAHGVSPGQVVLRWHHQLGSVPLPRSANADRQAQNLDLGGFELSSDELDSISSLGRAGGRLWGGDPMTTEL